jgi:hypothetical protein
VEEQKKEFMTTSSASATANKRDQCHGYSNNNASPKGKVHGAADVGKCFLDDVYVQCNGAPKAWIIR